MGSSTERATIVFNCIGYVLMALLALACILPFWVIITGSFTSENEVIAQGFKVWPDHFSLSAYVSLFSEPAQIINAYKVSIFVTTAGTLLGLSITSMAGYVLSRQDFKYRGGFSFYIYFTMLFSGGLIPWYIVIVKHLDLKDTYLALLLPFALSGFNILLMKGFMSSIPASIMESAKIDGAGDFTIFIKLILPLSTPGLATIGLFIALSYWNDWFLANLFITSENKYPLQFLLYRILASAAVLKSGVGGVVTHGIQPPSETLKMAAAVVVTGPIVFLYPFVQRYFVKGLMLGAVKG